MTTTEPSRIRDHADDFDWDWASEGSDWVPPAVEWTPVSAPRIYDYLLGGKDNFGPDRAAAAHLLQVAPYARDVARNNRQFLARAVRYLVRGCGIRQIIDLGTGLPTRPSVHEVARELAGDVRVVYVDNDPIVAAHNAAVLGTEPGIITLLRDLRAPDTVLDDPAVRGLIDFERPVGLLFVAVLHFVALDQAPAVLARYRDAVVPGSAVAISALCRDISDPVALRVAEALFEQSTSPLHARTTAQVGQLFEGFRPPVPLAPVSRWGLGPDDTRPSDDVPAAGLAGVGIKD
jgi:hypothetical protein